MNFARRSPLALVGILLVALVLRLGWAVSRPTDPATLALLPDQIEYLETAQSLLHGEGLTFLDPRIQDRLYAYRTPGYPVFIAACGGNVRIVRIAQCLLDTSTVLAAYLLARRWLSRGICLCAAILVAFNPFLIYFCGLLLTETLFTAMLIWGMYFLTSRRTMPWLSGGAILALSVLVRPGAIGLPVLLGVLAALLRGSPADPHRRRWPLPAGTTMLLLTFAALLPWAWRNHRVLGEWIWTSTNAGITSYDGFNPDATGASDQRFIESMRQLRRMSETGRSAYLGAAAQEYIRRNPGPAMELAAAKVARTWSPRPLSSEFAKPLYVAAGLAYAIPLDVLALIGLFSPRGRSLPGTAKLLLTAPAVYLTVAAAASVGSLRYRIPAEVPMAILAGAGLASLFSPSLARSSGGTAASDNGQREPTFS